MDLSSEKLNQIIILSRSLGKKGPMRFAEAHYLNLSIPHTAFLAFAFINAKFAHSKATTLRAQKKTCGTTVTKMEPLLSSVNSPRAFSRGDENPSKGTREKMTWSPRRL